MNCDYCIKGGTVIDFEGNSTDIKNIYVKDGLIIEPDDGSSIDPVRIIDASGKYVLPGLIDEHAHWNYKNGSLGVNADMVCPSAGITTAVDAGSTGIDNFEAFYQSNVMRYQTDVRAYLHISPQGVMATGKHEEVQDPEDINEEEIIKLFKKYNNCLKGLKLRISMHTIGSYGLEPLRKTVGLADKINGLGFKCSVVVHAAELPKDMEIESILDLLRPGDVYTHLYQNMGPTIIGEDGKVHSYMRKARDRGVLFSSGNGGKHWAWQILNKAYADGFYPDFISSDIVQYNKFIRPGFNLLYAMCTSLIAGMNEIDIFKAVTYLPAKHLGILDEAGSLEAGTRADIAIMDLMPLKVKFIDRFGDEEYSEKIFLPLLTMKDGIVVFRQIFFDGGNDNNIILRNYI